MKIGVRINKVNPRATIPTYQSDLAAGADLYACMGHDTIIPAGETMLIKTGIAIAVPMGCMGLIYARSGLASMRGLAPANKVGIIDADYRGEIIVALHNHSSKDQTIADGDRIAQFVIAPTLQADFEEVEDITDLDETHRGSRGFGSTGMQ